MWLFACMIFLGISGVAYGDLSTLANYVREHSDPDFVPQKEPGTPVNVFAVYHIINVADVDKRQNVVELETTTWFKWNTGITWDPAAYGGVDQITLPCREFWLPLIQTLDTANEYKNLGEQTVTAMANGTAFHFALHRDRFLCDLSHVETGADCHVIQTIGGYSVDQVHFDITEKTQAMKDIDPVKYFKGSHYEITRSGIVSEKFPFGSKEYQFWTMNFTVKEKEHHKGNHSHGHHSQGHHSHGHHSQGHHSPGHHSQGHHSQGHHGQGHHSQGHHSQGHHSQGHHSPSHHRRSHHRGCKDGRSFSHHNGGLTIHYHSHS